MSKTVKGILTVVAVGAIAFGVWHLTHQNAKAYAKAIIKLGGAKGYAELLVMEEGYLKAWARALSKGQADFSYQDKTYRTSGGTAVK